MNAVAGCSIHPCVEGAWESLPRELLAHVIEHVTDRNGSTAGLAALRLTCQQWRESVDGSLSNLQLRQWPGPCLAAGVLSCRFSSVRALDISGCGLQQHGLANSAGVSDTLMTGSSAVSRGSMRDQCSSQCSGPSDTLPARVVQISQHANGQGQCFYTEAKAAAQCSAVTPASSQQHAVTSFIAARYPVALPCAIPVAAQRMWSELSRMHALQHLVIGGAMLVLRSIRSSVQQPRTAAADSDDLTEPVKITHVYTLELPETVCHLSNLHSLVVEWYIPAPPSCCSSSSSSSGGGGGLHAAVICHDDSSGIIIPGRRRSYEGSPAPLVFHTADPVLHLPSQLNNLTNLQQLTLAASFTNSSALNPLLGLPNLQVLALGPGELDIRALVVLAKGGVMSGLKRLVLQQQGHWHAPAFATMLGGMRQLQQLEVVELEVCRPRPNAVIPPEQHLTAEHMAPLAATLHTLAWTTCSQRLAQGCSMLCRTPAAGSAETAAAGSWFGGCTALTHLQLAGSTGVISPGSCSPGIQTPRSAVVSAPVIEMLSPSIGECRGLEVLQVQGLGVPLLPQALTQLQELHTVRIQSTRVARRAHHAADRALAVLGSCKGLLDLTLAGCELRTLPAWLSGLQHLSSLNLQGNYLQELPGCSPGLGLPVGLQVLNLSDNRLREVPEGLGDLSRLQRLILDENYLCSLPQQVWQLPELTELSIRENMLPLLPELPSSSRLAASSSAAVTEGQQDVGAAAMSARSAGFRPASSSKHQRTDSTSNSSSRCSELRMLHLGCNQLAQLPSGISLLTKLKDLDLGHNQLRTLPESGSIWALTRLTALQLSHNHLKKLPAGISNLQQLVKLDISGNHLPVTSSNSKKRPAAAVTDADGKIPVTPAAGSTPATTAAAQHPTVQRSSDRNSGRLTAAEQRQLPAPLRALRQLQQLRIGGQQQEHLGGHQCPLQLLLGGLVDLIEVVRSLAPPHHQCPVTKAAAAAVAHLSRISTGRRGRRERARQLAERVRFEPGWVLLPAPKGHAAAAAPSAAAAAPAGAYESGW